jgi:hypothetical protein
MRMDYLNIEEACGLLSTLGPAGVKLQLLVPLQVAANSTRLLHGFPNACANETAGR